MEDWLQRINEEYKQFKENMLNMNAESIYNNYEIIMLYEKIHTYLMNTQEDLYKDLSLMEIYDWYTYDDYAEFNLATDEGIVQLLDYVEHEHNRHIFYKKYEDEFGEFKYTYLKLMNFEEQFKEYERIRFYNIVYDYIQNKEYCDVKQHMRDRSILELWIQFNKLKEDMSINNTTLLENFLDNTK